MCDSKRFLSNKKQSIKVEKSPRSFIFKIFRYQIAYEGGYKGFQKEHKIHLNSHLESSFKIINQQKAVELMSRTDLADFLDPHKRQSNFNDDAERSIKV